MMAEVKMTTVEVTIRNMDDNVMYFSYRVARRCNIDNVDFVDPRDNVDFGDPEFFNAISGFLCCIFFFKYNNQIKFDSFDHN